MIFVEYLVLLIATTFVVAFILIRFLKLSNLLPASALMNIIIRIPIVSLLSGICILTLVMVISIIFCSSNPGKLGNPRAWTYPKIVNFTSDDHVRIMKDLLLELEGAGNYPTRKNDLEDATAAFIMGSKFKQTPQKLGCITLPRLHDIIFSNKHWQVMRTISDAAYNSSYTNHYIYGAYLDIRNYDNPKIRIQTVADKYLKFKEKEMPQYCQIWYPDENRVEVVSVTGQFSPWIWGPSGYIYHHYVYSCNMPTRSLYGRRKWTPADVPISVSLVREKCETATNNVKIVFNMASKKKDFLICLKALDFPTKDISKDLIDKLELLKFFGVEGVHFPILSVVPETMKLLKYYEATGFVTIKPYSLPGSQNNLPLTRHVYFQGKPTVKRKQELVPYNDCLLSNIYQYKYIGILDIDEILLPPANVPFYQDLFRSYWKRNYTSVCFKMKQFVNRIKYSENETVEIVTESNDPDTPEFVKHVFFDKGPLCNAHRMRLQKCFFRTNKILAVHNHYITKCLEGHKCSTKDVPITEGYIHHHRGTSDSCRYNASSDAPDLIQNPFGYDPHIQKYTDPIIRRRNLVLKEIQVWETEHQIKN